MEGATVAHPLCVSFQLVHRMKGPTDGAAGARPPLALFAHDRTCHCWPCRPHFSFESHVWQDLGKSVYRTRKVHNITPGKPCFSPPSPVFALAPARLAPLPRLPRAPRPSWALSVLCRLSSLHWPFLPERARCIAIREASWHPTLCCPPSGCTRALPVFRPCPSASPPWVCAHGAEQCARHSVSLFWAPLPLQSPPTPSSVLPLSLCAASLWALCMTIRKTPCTTLTFSPVCPRHLWAIDALPAAPTASAAAPAAGGSAERGAPSGGCCRGIP